MDFKVVIGANYGDEGKGLVTNFLAKKAIKEGKNPIVILNNGGPQRGHTVVEKGIRHVFHHFGSATLLDVPTYITRDFCINPMIFIDEYEELKKLGIHPNVIIHPDCLVTTPFEMMVSQIVSKIRNVHNSCGLGIWQTFEYRHRYRDVYGFKTKTIEELLSKPSSLIKNFLLERFKDVMMDICSEIDYYDEWTSKSLIMDTYELYFKDIDISGLIDHWIKDLNTMKMLVRIKPIKTFEGLFDTAIIENGQGILLDKSNKENSPTSSDTGAKGAYRFIKYRYLSTKEDNVELVYVTRTYITRHGDGYTIGKIMSKDLSDKLIDNTNIPNEWQGSLKYRHLEEDKLMKRIDEDSNIFDGEFNTSVSLAVTHANEFYLPDVFPKYLNRVKYISESEDDCFENSGIFSNILLGYENVHKFVGWRR